MDKNTIKKYLNKTFISEVGGTPAINLAAKIAKDNKKVNKAGVDAIGKDMKEYEKPLKPDTNAKDMAQNKFNYTDDTEKVYHDEMEIMNGQEMIQYDRTPSDEFKDRALEAIEGSARMGNDPKWANVVAKGQGGDPEFGKNLVKKIKSSVKKRSEQTPTSKMFGDDWEVIEDEGHKPYALENKTTTKENLDKQSGTNQSKENTNKKKPQIKETMKRLKFKKEFNGVGNALKLIPEGYKVDNKVFEMTDGNESYKIRWEGSLTEGKAVILIASDKTMINEDIKKMKHLMGYKSEDTLGTLKGKSRLNEDKAFADVYAKTKKLLGETEDIDGQDAEKEAPFEEADIKQAPEAKKHVQGSASTEKGTQAPKPKEGPWEEADVNQAAEAKKHVQGSVSTEKGTQAPKPKEGEWETAKKGAAPEATKDIKKKSLTEAELDDEDDVDAPEIGRSDAYDASLDVADPEDMVSKVSKRDIEQSMNTPKTLSITDVDDEDDELDTELDTTDVKFVASKTRPGVFGLMVKIDGKTVGVEDVPSNFVELARRNPKAAYAKIKAQKEMSDDDLMEEIDKHFGINTK